nr:MAG TPA: hypothetical protein [Caudoviricetes sp.]
MEDLLVNLLFFLSHPQLLEVDLHYLFILVKSSLEMILLLDHLIFS